MFNTAQSDIFRRLLTMGMRNLVRSIGLFDRALQAPRYGRLPILRPPRPFDDHDVAEPVPVPTEAVRQLTGRILCQPS